MKTINIAVDNLSQEEIWTLCRLIKTNVRTDIILSEKGAENMFGQNVSIQDMISDLLKHLGMAPYLAGFCYTITAIEMCLMEEEMMFHITQKIYPQIAKKYDTTSSKVEHAIREVIHRGIQNNPTNYQKIILGEEILSANINLSNSEFIAMVADYIIINQIHREEQLRYRNQYYNCIV